ncbi:MAG: hypothetical protein KF709_02630 [Gemmatimonadaceae bacterium]|nr:hypothetical protein [Gemmatimonadaceae bacterium]
MIYEVCELLTTHLRDPQYGVAALSPSVPLPPGDPAVEEVTVVSEFEIDYLPGMPIPPAAYEKGPLVLVRRGDDVTEFSAPGNPEIVTADGRVGCSVLVLYPRQAIYTRQIENRRLSATLRAVRASVGLWLERIPYEERSLRGVQVVSAVAGSSLRVLSTVFALSEVDTLCGAVILELQVTDRWAELDPLAIATP